MVNRESILGFLAVLGTKQEGVEQYLAGVIRFAERVGNLEVRSFTLGELTLYYWERATPSTVIESQNDTDILQGHDKDQYFSMLMGNIYEDISQIESSVEQFAGLNGRYAWIGWKPSQHKFSATSDFLGIRALFYLEAADVFLMTNEPSVLVNSPGFTGELDPVGCVDMLQKGYSLGDRTIFKQIRHLHPGAQLIRDHGHTQIVQKSILPVPFPKPLTGEIDELADGLWERLLKSTERRIGKRRDWHVMLSGGLDSRVCAGLLHAVDALGGAFNWGKASSGDSRVPGQLAKALGIKLKRINIPRDHLQTYHRDLVTLNASLTNAHITYLIAALSNIPEPLPPLVIGYSGDPLTGGHVPLITSSGEINPTLEASVDHFYNYLEDAFKAPELAELLLQENWVAAIDASRHEMAEMMAASGSSLHYQRWIAALLWCRQLRYTTFLPRLCDNFTPTFSPFEDLEVFQYCLGLPPEGLKDQLIYRRMISRHLPNLANFPRSDGSFVDPSNWRSKVTQIYRKLVSKLPDRLRWRFDWWSGGGYAVDPNADLRIGSSEYLRSLLDERQKWESYFDYQQVATLIEGHLSGKQLAGFRIQALVMILESIMYSETAAKSVKK